jgi:hypothetical protein
VVTSLYFVQAVIPEVGEYEWFSLNGGLSHGSALRE